ncbi:hypothetical protein DMENIID0001_010210 [Sergentomyia squamirostris]
MDHRNCKHASSHNTESPVNVTLRPSSSISFEMDVQYFWKCPASLVEKFQVILPGQMGTLGLYDLQETMNFLNLIFKLSHHDKVVPLARETWKQKTLVQRIK